MGRSVGWKETPALVHVVPAVLCAAAIFALSHVSYPPGSGMVPDYLAHFFEYAFFAGTLIWAVTWGGKNSLMPSRTILVWLIAVAWGALDELHQSFVPYREVSLADFIADSLGAGFSVLLIYSWMLVRRKRSGTSWVR